MKVFITGAAGFIGGYLTKHCLEQGCPVLGVDVVEPDNTKGDFERCDVRDAARLTDLIASFRPDWIFHLAAQSYPTVSLTQPFGTMNINAGGTINVFEGLRTAGLMTRVVVACSSAEYGPVAPENSPVREDHPLHPLHPYGVSKVAQDLLAAQYFANYSLPCVRIRIFNTTGPGKLGDVCSDLTRRAVEIEMGIRDPSLLVGNTTNRRAIIDVRDFVRALWLAAEHCVAGEVYNLGADRIYSIQEIIDAIQTQVSVPFQVEQQRALLRACDEPVIAGSNAKFRNCCAWTPEIPLLTTLRDMLDWWRVRMPSTVNAPTAPNTTR